MNKIKYDDVEDKKNEEYELSLSKNIVSTFIYARFACILCIEFDFFHCGD